jgi:hypothetical protein
MVGHRAAEERAVCRSAAANPNLYALQQALQSRSRVKDDMLHDEFRAAHTQLHRPAARWQRRERRKIAVDRKCRCA